MEKSKNLKIAIVHDFLLYYGGAEKVLEVLAEMFPKAPIYTLLYDKERMSAQGGPAFGWRDRDVRTSFLQKFPKFLRKKYSYFLPLLPTAPETFDLREFDLVISTSGAWCKGIVTKLNTIHVAYIHSPMRFAWDYNERYLKENRKEKLAFFVRPFLNYLRVWDKMAADRPDYLIANSRYTQERIKKYYRKESVVIYPPANIFTDKNPSLPLPLKRGENDYFLIVSRLSAYKKIDVAVNAFNKLGLPLVIIGEGNQKEYLKSIAGENVKILGWQSEEKKQWYYKNARAFVAVSVEDFGITPVEAMSFGVPVVALREGGFLETVIEGKTGEFFDAPTAEVLADGVRRFLENENNYDKEDIKNRAMEFSKERFVKELGDFLGNI